MSQVSEVKNIMVDNIEKVLERGEKIELLVDKTDNLRFQAGIKLSELCHGVRMTHIAVRYSTYDRDLVASMLQADKFHKTGKQLRSKMWWQNMRMKIIIVFAVLVLILVIFLLVRRPLILHIAHLSA